MKNKLDSRTEIGWLVRTFYDKIRADEMLGFIFNGIISDWEPHLEKLTDFWESNLLFFTQTRFQGDPAKAHVRVDEWSNQTLTMEHFGRWIHLWLNTIDEHFEGEHADRAKNLARKMGTFLFMKIVENRKHGN